MAALNPSSPDHQNINISAYRVLYILLVLVHYRSLNVHELNRFLYENPLIERGYNTETLTKYINTLREVGCEIPRSSNRNEYSYELLRSPFPLSLEPEELAVAEKLLELLAEQPDELLYNDYRELLEHLDWALHSPDNRRLNGTAPLAGQNPLFPTLEARRQSLHTLRRYCKDAFTLLLSYRHDDGQTIEMLLEPHELMEQGKRLYLLGLEPSAQEQIMLDADRIESIWQLPSKSKHRPTQTTVVFALYGRLAKSYRPYPGEKTIYRTDEELRIKTKVTEPIGLMNRLMKYGASCQVVSPDSLRTTMHKRITQLLETLDEPGKPLGPGFSTR